MLGGRELASCRRTGAMPLSLSAPAPASAESPPVGPVVALIRPRPGDIPNRSARIPCFRDRRRAP